MKQKKDRLFCLLVPIFFLHFFILDTLGILGTLVHLSLPQSISQLKSLQVKVHESL
jgi:hypothetical protein